MGKCIRWQFRPALTYVSEMRDIKRAQEDKLDVVEIRMLRWVSGHTLMDRVEKRVIRERMKVIELHQKV